MAPSSRVQHLVQSHGRAQHTCVFAAIGGQLQTERQPGDRHRNRDGRCAKPRPRRIYSWVTSVRKTLRSGARRCRHQDDGRCPVQLAQSQLSLPDLPQRLLVALCRHFQTLLDEVGQFEQARAMFLPPLLVKPRTFIERDIVGCRIEGLQKICDINRLRADARPS